MASLTYDSFWDDVMHGAVVPSADTFYGMVVSSSYAPNKGTHTRRSDVTNEISGTGYTAGGAATAATVTKDAVNHRVDITFADILWAAATMTGRGIVVYKRRGGAASADELVGYVDWGADVTSTAALFTATFTAPLRVTN